MTIIQRRDPRRSKRIIKVPKLVIPEAPWANEDSEDDPSFIPTSLQCSSSSEDDISLDTEGTEGTEEDVCCVQSTDSIESTDDEAPNSDSE
jgi:hypothetical protein